MNIRSLIGVAFAATYATAAAVWSVSAFAHGAGETVTENFNQRIPNVPGKSLIAVVVDYAPGAASPAHLHANSAFIYAYVVSGAIESQVNDGPKRIYRAGESFSESPGSRHPVSRNASATQPARLLAVFVVDTSDKVLTTPIHSSVTKESKQ